MRVSSASFCSSSADEIASTISYFRRHHLQSHGGSEGGGVREKGREREGDTERGIWLSCDLIMSSTMYYLRHYSFIELKFVRNVCLAENLKNELLTIQGFAVL